MTEEVDFNAAILADRTPPPATSSNGTPSPNGKAKQVPPNARSDRWQTLNEFVDLIAPGLTLAERAVWLVMFRHARGGVVETTTRSLATAAAIDKETVSLALKAFEAMRLVWPIWKSKDRSKSSKYAMHQRPAECLARVMKRRARK